MRLYIGHVTRGGAFIMPCMFMVCAESVEHVLEGLCEQYKTYFKNLPEDAPMSDLSVTFNIEMLPTDATIIEPLVYDFFEILINMTDESEDGDDGCIKDAEGV